MATEQVAFSFYKIVMERKKIKRAIKVIVIVCLVLVTGFFILNSVIQKKIRQQLTNLSPALVMNFSKVHANIFSSSVSFDSLNINFIPYNERQQNRHHLFFSSASLNGISFLKFLFSKKLEASHLFLDNGNLVLDSFLLDKKDSAQSQVFDQVKWPFKKLYIRNLDLKKMQVILRSESNDHLLTKGDIALSGVYINKPGDVPVFNNIDVRLSDLDYASHDYSIRVGQLITNSNNKTLETDSLRITSQDKLGDIMIPSLKMTGFDVMKLMNEKILIAKKLVAAEGKISVAQNEKSKTTALPFALKKIHINDLRCNSSSVSYKDKTNEFRFIANIELEELDIDSSLKIDGSHIGSVYGNISGLYYSGINYHTAEIRNIEIDSKKQLIQINEVNITPRLDKYEFQSKSGHQADWVQAHISRIEIKRPDFDKLLHQKLFADKISIGESKAYIFRDRRLPRSQKNIPLPVDIIKTFPVDIRIHSCELATSAVAYEEYPKEGYGMTGILKIEKIKLSLSPFINHPLPSDPAYITMNVEGSIMGSGTSHAIVMMPLQKNKPYQIKGAIEKLELTKLNSSSENLGKIRIKSGFLDFLSFDFTMTERRSTGKIIGAYHHLIIQQLKKGTEEKNVADLASFALRHAIIPLNKDASLPESKRTGKVDYQRDPTRMVSYYFLQSLLMGVKKSFTLGFLLPK
jgi:hypothetical protein